MSGFKFSHASENQKIYIFFSLQQNEEMRRSPKQGREKECYRKRRKDQKKNQAVRMRGRKKEGREEERKEERKDGRKEARKEGRKEGS